MFNKQFFIYNHKWLFAFLGQKCPQCSSKIILETGISVWAPKKGAQKCHYSKKVSLLLCLKYISESDRFKQLCKRSKTRLFWRPVYWFGHPKKVHKNVIIQKK